MLDYHNCVAKFQASAFFRDEEVGKTRRQILPLIRVQHDCLLSKSFAFIATAGVARVPFRTPFVCIVHHELANVVYCILQTIVQPNAVDFGATDSVDSVVPHQLGHRITPAIKLLCIDDRFQLGCNVAVDGKPLGILFVHGAKQVCRHGHAVNLFIVHCIDLHALGHIVVALTRFLGGSKLGLLRFPPLHFFIFERRDDFAHVRFAVASSAVGLGFL